MKISTRARYGTRALLDLALQEGHDPVLLKDIAGRQDISVHYLEHLVAPLIASGMVRSIRGARGGVRLAKPAGEIRLIDIVKLYEGSTAPVECVDKPAVCKRSDDCVTRDIWTDLKGQINGYLSSITLQDLVEQHNLKTQPEMYYI